MAAERRHAAGYRASGLSRSGFSGRLARKPCAVSTLPFGWGRALHVVQYPVRRGEWLNVVAIVHDEAVKRHRTATNWDQNATVAGLRTSLAGTCSALQDLINAMTGWRLWALCDRNPMAGAREHGAGRVVLVGDAAHPMRPYLAQGAGMAIEDAAELERLMSSQPGVDIVPTALGQFAHARWQRNARVQARSIRNGEIFHASGPGALGT